MLELLPDYLTHLNSKGRSKLTISSYRQRVQMFLRWLAGRPINLRRLIDYKDYLQLDHAGREGEGCRPRTIRLHFAALSSFWKYAIHHGYRDLPPIGEVEIPRLDKENATWVNARQAEKLIAAAALVGREASDSAYAEFLRWRAEMVICLGLSLGLRRKEMKELKRADYVKKDHRAHLRIRKTKGGESRNVPVPDFAQAKIEAWLQVRDKRCKRFKKDPGTLMMDRGCHPMGDYSLDSALKQVVALAGLEDAHITPHSLRHGCATYLLRLGIDPETVRQILGHANVSTTWKYVHTDQEAMTDAMDKLGGALGGKREQVPPPMERAARPPVRRPRDNRRSAEAPRLRRMGR